MFNQESSKILNKISNKDNSCSNLPLVSLEWEKKLVVYVGALLILVPRKIQPKMLSLWGSLPIVKSKIWEESISHKNKISEVSNRKSQFFRFESNWNSIKEMDWNNSIKLTHKWTLASCATSWPFKIKQETIIQVPCALVLLLLLQWALKINSPCYRFIHKACICYHGKTNVPW